MALASGQMVNATIVNGKVEEISPDGAWYRCSLQPDLIDGTRANVWLPQDFRVSTVPSVPANWPPLVGDVWRVGTGTATAWIVDTGTGTLEFVTSANIKNNTQPMTIDQALGRFGTQLNLVTRLPAA